MQRAVPQPRAPRPLPVTVLALVMTVWEPLILAVSASAALPRLAAYGGPAYLLLVFRGLVAASGIAAGRAVWAGEPSAQKLALAWIGLALTAALLTFATPFFPSNRAPGDKALALAATIGWYAGWALYLLRSRRVRLWRQGPPPR